MKRFFLVMGWVNMITEVLVVWVPSFRNMTTLESRMMNEGLAALWFIAYAVTAQQGKGGEGE